MHPATLRSWAIQGKIKFIQTEGGKRFYSLIDIESIFTPKKGTETIKQEKKKFCYARVSSDHQRGDLERQINDLKFQFPNHEIISDVASGLNWKRKGLLALLEQVHEGLVGEVVVAHKDRLARFGVDLLEWIFKKAGTQLVVLDHQNSEEDQSRSSEQELAEDLLSVVTVFVAKNNGRRSSENRRKRALEIARKQDEETKDQEEEI